MKRVLSMVLSIALLFSYVPVSATARKLPGEQQKMAEKLGEMCEEKWERYGVLPSVCIAQAFIESTLGKNCSGHNLWGIRSGAEKYNSLEEGVERYLKVINNGYYDGAPFQRDYHKQIKAIVDGGYCVPAGDYYERAVWAIETYGFDKYDKKLFERLREEERREQQSKKFKVVYDKSVPKYKVEVDKSIIRKGTIMFVVGQEVVMTDVVSGAKGRVIKTSRKELCGTRVNIRVFENAVG